MIIMSTENPRSLKGSTIRRQLNKLGVFDRVARELGIGSSELSRRLANPISDMFENSIRKAINEVIRSN